MNVQLTVSWLDSQVHRRRVILGLERAEASEGGALSVVTPMAQRAQPCESNHQYPQSLTT